MPGVAAGPPAPLPAIRRYEVLEEPGQGAMGVVYRARHTRLERLVALKMIRTGAQASAEVVARFRTEVALQAQVQHPNVVQIFEIGETAGWVVTVRVSSS